MSAILKPGPFKRITAVHLNSLCGYGSFQWGTAMDSRIAYPPNAGSDLMIYVFCFVFSRPTFPPSWIGHQPEAYRYKLEYKGNDGRWILINEGSFYKRWFAYGYFMNDVVVADRVLPPGPFLDENAQGINYDTIGYDLDYGLIYLGHRYRDSRLNATPNGYVVIDQPDQFLDKIIRITLS
ncbi:MAG: hypothetical protein HQL95_10980 [Magnetococcales bacterium]|nr:hypothetical protein [Magnetococcales bacterium]